MQKAFISYCREDKGAAQKLYGRLCAFGVDAWLDEHKLTLGQDWQYEVSKAIEASDYFLAVISKKSLAKRGHVQREIKQACYIQESLPEGKVFIIPCKLEDCELPVALAALHWIECFPNFERACRRIAKAVGSTIVAEPVSRKTSTSKPLERQGVTIPPNFVHRMEELERALGDISDADILRKALSLYYAAATEAGRAEPKVRDDWDDGWLSRFDRMVEIAA